MLGLSSLPYVASLHPPLAKDVARLDALVNRAALRRPFLRARWSAAALRWLRIPQQAPHPKIHSPWLGDRRG